MRGRKCRKAGGAALAALALLAARTSLATLLVPMSDEDLVASSDVIAIGRVANITTALLDDRRVVTRITFSVEEALKGTPTSETIMITEPGGRMAGLAVVIFDAPEYVTGERAVIFLRVRRDGTLSTTARALGKYRIEPDAGGTPLARRLVPRPDVRPLAAFTARIAQLATSTARGATDGRAGAGIQLPALETVTDAFVLSGTTPARWFEADCGLPVVYSRGNAEETLGDDVSRTALAQAAAAWTAVEGASIVLGVGADSTIAPSEIGGTSDGRNTVQFNDPFDEVEDTTNCTGTLGRGGFVSSFDADRRGLNKTVGGVAFGRIFEGDVTLNQGVGACYPDPLLLAELLAHELGHTIGFGHSSQDPSESDPVLEDAIMYFRAHNDGRGASIRQDDIAALTASYPAALAATTPVAALACRFDLGLFDLDCFNQQLAAAPFTRFNKARAMVVKAAAAPTPKKQKKLLKKALQLITKTDKAIVRSITGTCGTAMRAIVAGLREATNGVIGAL